MLAINKYIAAIEQQQAAIERSSRRFTWFFTPHPNPQYRQIQQAIPWKKYLRSIDEKTILIRLQANALFSHLEAKKDSLEGAELGTEVRKIKDVIRNSIAIRKVIEYASEPTSANRLARPNERGINIEKAIETLYMILRLVTRLNKPQIIETTQLATDLSDQSWCALTNRGNSN